MSPDLPPDLRSALDQLAQGKSRRELAARADAISHLYRSGAGSRAAIGSTDDALAYAFTRLPATYAAAAAALSAAREAVPDFAPRTLIDAGAGPGTATFAAIAQFDALDDIRLIDDNPHLRTLALGLLAASADPALRAAHYAAHDLVAALRGAAPADLVLASYVIGELSAADLTRVADALWSATGDVLVVIEPGTPAGFARIRALRAHLVARGAHALAPCPHDQPCPIVDPDWCHFAQRLQRSREHRQVKGGALAFEDEKFSYVALARSRRPPASARVLAHPRIGKAGVSAKLCGADGIVTVTAGRRERDPYKALKSWHWGEAVVPPATEHQPVTSAKDQLEQ